MKRRNLRPVSRRSLGQRHSFGVVALAALALAGCASGPPDSQTPARPPSSFAVPGLEKPAEVLVDRWGVPHLYAGTLYDAFVAQGFIAARDRLWQMDLWRKRGLGEMAKDFGPAWVENDRAARAVLYRGDMYREWLAYGSDAKRVAGDVPPLGVQVGVAAEVARKLQPALGQAPGRKRPRRERRQQQAAARQQPWHGRHHDATSASMRCCAGPMSPKAFFTHAASW